MNKMSLAGLIVSSVALVSMASADPLLSTAEPRANLTALAKDLSKYVVVLNKPVYVYNWFNAGNRNPVWKTQFDSSGQLGSHHLESMGRQYFQSYCTNNPALDPADCSSDDVTKLFGRGNYYGPGLYASTDPVATSSYGGGADWVMMQIRLPKGFRFASLVWGVKNDTLSAEGTTELSTMCPGLSQSNISGTLQTILQYARYNQGAGGSLESQNCFAGLRKLLKEQLRIDGLYYNYDATQFSFCGDQLDNGGRLMSGNSIRNAAFVISQISKIQPSDVKIFNSQTTTDKETRKRIASVFYKAVRTQSGTTMTPQMQASIQYYNRVGIPNQPGFTVGSFATNTCATFGQYNNVCGNWYSIVNPTSGTNGYAPLVDAPADSPEMLALTGPTPVKVVQKISSATAPSQMQSLTGYSSSNANRLLWADLEGEDQDENIEQWIKGSFLGCRDIAPFGAVPNLRYGRQAPRSSINADIDNGG